MSKIINLRIIFSANSEDNLVNYIDSNYIRLIDSQKSLSDYIFMLSGRLLSYKSKLQSTIALLSTKAKYIAIVKVEKEVLWIVWFLACFKSYLPNYLIKLCADNKKAIAQTKNPKFN